MRASACWTRTAPNDIGRFFIEGRYLDPIGYANGVSALPAMALFPAFVLAYRRETPALLRPLALAASVRPPRVLAAAPEPRGADRPDRRGSAVRAARVRSAAARASRAGPDRLPRRSRSARSTTCTTSRRWPPRARRTRRPWVRCSTGPRIRCCSPRCWLSAAASARRCSTASCGRDRIAVQRARSGVAAGVVLGARGVWPPWCSPS